MYKVISLFKTATIRESVITSSATFLTAGLGAIFYLLVAKLTGPREYGLFSLSLQIMLALAPLADAGTGTVLVRFVGQHSENEKYLPYASIALRLKLVFSTLCFLILTIFSKPIAVNILNQPDIWPLLPFSGLGIMALVLMSFTTSTLQGLQKFIPWGATQIGANLLRLLMVMIFFSLSILNAKIALVAFIISVFSTFIFGWKWLNINIISIKTSIKIFKEFWSFGKWTALFTIVSAIVSRLDSFYTARYLDISQTGLYSLAITMSSFLPQLTAAIGAVTSPKFAKFTSNSDLSIYRKKALMFSSALSITVSFIMIPTALIVIKLTGKDFNDSFIPFVILLISMCIFASTGPIRDSILFGYKDPKFFFYAALIQGIVVTISGLTLIPIIGITGAALGSLLSHIVLALVCILYVRKKSS